MCQADVTSSQRWPGFGCKVSRERTAFSCVLRDVSSSTMRDASMPNAVKNARARSAPDVRSIRAPEPPENTSRASGCIRARTVASVMRSAASFKDMSSRTPGAVSSMPPSTMMPSMRCPAIAGLGNRASSGPVKRSATGESPITSVPTRLPVSQRKPASIRPRRISHTASATAKTRRLDGCRQNQTVLER